MVECNASDLYLTTGAPPQVKVDGVVQALPFATLVPGQVQKLAQDWAGSRDREYECTMECNIRIRRKVLVVFGSTFTNSGARPAW